MLTGTPVPAEEECLPLWITNQPRAAAEWQPPGAVFLSYAAVRQRESARLLADVGQDAAVHIQNQAVDEVGSFGSQEDGGAAQVLGFAPAAGRGLGDDELVEGMTGTVGLNLTQRSGLRGGDVAGADAVALDVGPARSSWSRC